MNDFTQWALGLLRKENHTQEILHAFSHLQAQQAALDLQEQGIIRRGQAAYDAAEFFGQPTPQQLQDMREAELVLQERAYREQLAAEATLAAWSRSQRKRQNAGLFIIWVLGVLLLSQLIDAATALPTVSLGVVLLKVLAGKKTDTHQKHYTRVGTGHRSTTPASALASGGNPAPPSLGSRDRESHQSL